MLLLFLSFLGDFLWLFYWTPHWWGKEMRDKQFYLHSFVILASFANFILKLIVLGTLGSIDSKELDNAPAGHKSYKKFGKLQKQNEGKLSSLFGRILSKRSNS